MNLKKNSKEILAKTEKTLNKVDKLTLSIYKRSLTDIRKQLLEMDKKTEMSLNELYKYDRLTKLQDQIADQVKNISLEVYKEVLKTNKGISKQAYDLKGQAIAKQEGSAIAFDKISTEQIKQIVNDVYPGLSLKDLFNKATNDTINKLKIELGAGLTQGLSLGKIAANIKNTLEVSAGRAMRIARTEGLRVMSKAQLEATDEAQKLGLQIKKIWAHTSGTKNPREQHIIMDGQEADKDGYFTTPDGVKMLAPRMSGDPSHDINCTCTYYEEVTIPDEL